METGPFHRRSRDGGVSFEISLRDQSGEVLVIRNMLAIYGSGRFYLGDFPAVPCFSCRRCTKQNHKEHVLIIIIIIRFDSFSGLGAWY